MPAPAALLFQAATAKLISLSPVDIAIIVLYFAMVLGIGFYLKRFSGTGEDFFLAGREMTAWIAGLSFVVGEPRFARTDGMGRFRLSIRHSGDALVLDRRHTRHAVPRPHHDAVLLHFQDAFSAWLLEIAVR